MSGPVCSILALADGLSALLCALFLYEACFAPLQEYLSVKLAYWPSSSMILICFSLTNKHINYVQDKTLCSKLD